MVAKIEDAPGVGNVEIVLGEERIELKPSLGAAIALQSLPGGLLSADEHDDSVFRRVQKCDIATMCAVIRAGVGVSGSTDPKLPEKIYAFGLLDLRPLLTVYVVQLANGGKKAGQEAAKDKDPLPASA
jgi:hypothetical protein